MRDSVTEVECTCGYLERESSSRWSPIVFDPLVNEYHFTFPDPEGDGTTTAKLFIYHCPWCGGAAPKSKRGLLFAEIHPEEEQRLRDLLAPIETSAEMQRVLGLPDDSHREYRYTSLSAVADVHFYECSTGEVHFSLHRKYLDGRYRTDSAPP